MLCYNAVSELETGNELHQNEVPYTIQLSEQDIPGTSLSGRPPAQLKVKELRFWLKCRGDSGKGLKTKAQLVRR